MDTVLFTVSKSEKVFTRVKQLKALFIWLSPQKDLPYFGSLSTIHVSGFEFYFTKKFCQY